MKLIVWSENSPMGGKRAHEERGDDTLVLEGSAIELIHRVAHWDTKSEFNLRVKNLVRQEVYENAYLEDVEVSEFTEGVWCIVKGYIKLCENSKPIRASWSFEGEDPEPVQVFLADPIVHKFMCQWFISEPEVLEVYIHHLKDLIIQRVDDTDDLEYLLQLLGV